MAAFKSLIRDDEPDNLIRILTSLKMDFKTYCSNYAIKIVVNDQIINFAKNEMSRSAFSGASKVKSDLMNFPVPELDFDDVHYFQHDFREPIYVEQVYNIDLKSAYAYILYMDDLIQKKTFKYLCSLRKKERLQAVGMIASRKEVFEYRRGQVIGKTTERSELSGFFFYAVKRTSEIMGELKKICGKSYLFTWVDGIYFLPDPGIATACKEYLSTIQFPFASELLSEFEVKFMPHSIKVSFLKSEDAKRKQFDLPFEDSAYKKLASKLIFHTK